MADLYKRPKPTVLIIMDGVGVAPPGPGNAVSLADTPFLDKYWPKYPHTYLKASGLDVGLPNGIDGNSEVGHLNIGAGKIVFQNLPRIDMSIKDGSFYQNKVILDGLKQMKALKSNLHIVGLIGGGAVHSSISHLFSLIKLLHNEEVNGDKVFLHLFTDGRDSPPQEAAEYLQQIEIYCKSKSIGRISSLCGRYYGMDRDERWDRTKKAYDLITQNIGTKVNSYSEALEISYKSGKTDEFLESYVITENKKPISKFQSGDVVIMYNFRGDRAIQLTQAFEDNSFKGFEREFINDIYLVGMTNYEKNFPKKIAFPPERIGNPLGKIISQNGLKQLRIAESEKFPHVTYFFDNGNEKIYPGQDSIEVPSPKDVPTYDKKPEMSALILADIVLEKIDSEEYDLIIINFANPDMVAHTGVLDATIKAVEVVDHMAGRIIAKVLDKKGAVILTSDHGNAEELIDLDTGKIDTKHSTNSVPFLIIKPNETPRELSVGILADIAPTILGIMGIEKPTSMTGRNLLV